MNDLIIFPSKFFFSGPRVFELPIYTIWVFLFSAILACEMRCKYIVVIILSNNSLLCYNGSSCEWTPSRCQKGVHKNIDFVWGLRKTGFCEGGRK